MIRSSTLLRTIAGFLKLGPHRRGLALECWIRLLRMRMRVRAGRIDRLTSEIDARAGRGARCTTLAPADVLQLLTAAARRTWPAPTCLTTAVTGYALLRERGVPAVLVIGGRTSAGRFEAHAWLELAGEVVIGAPNAGYAAIWQWPGGNKDIACPP